MDAVLTDLLFTTDLSVKEIAVRLGVPVTEVKGRIAALGLGWVRAHERMSRGHYALYMIMQKLIPGEDVVTEQPIGERLKLDIYCPKFRLAAEYHGQQHYAYSEHFHGDMEGYNEACRRDVRKILLCELKDIALVVFNAKDPMTEDYVFKRLLEAMERREPVPQVVAIKQVDQFVESQREQQREYRKNAYRRMKQERKI